VKTEKEIVLTIFGGERCVASLDDLEAVAKAIQQKAVRESETSANPSIPGAKIEGQNSPINAEFDPSQTKEPKP
jgi:hypothetical protein